MIRLIGETFKSIKPYFLFKIGSSILIQLSSMFLIYLLNPKDYGAFSLILSISQIMFVLTSGWSNGAIINLGTKRYNETNSYFDIVIYRSIIVICSFIFISIIFLCFQSFIANFIGSYDSLRVVFYLFIGYVLYDFSYQLLYPGNKNNIQSLIELVYTILLFGLTILFVNNIDSYAQLFLLLNIILFSITIILFFKFFRRDVFKCTVSGFKEIFIYSSWQLMSVIGIYVINLGNNYVFVFNNISLELIGLYNFAFKIFSGFSLVFGLFGILIPKWVHSESFNPVELQKKIFKIIFILLLGYLAISMGLSPFIKLIGKNDYLEAVDIYLLMFPAFIFMCYVNMMNAVIANTKHYRFAQYAILMQMGTIFLLGIPLVYFLSIYGAIVSLSISYLICAVFFYFIFKRVVKERSLVIEENNI